MPREVLRSERYECPVCQRLYGELMNTGHLSEHHALDGDGYTLCRGSRTPIVGLTVGSSELLPGTPAFQRVMPGQAALFDLNAPEPHHDPEEP